MITTTDDLYPALAAARDLAELDDQIKALVDRIADRYPAGERPRDWGLAIRRIGSARDQLIRASNHLTDQIAAERAAEQSEADYAEGHVNTVTTGAARWPASMNEDVAEILHHLAAIRSTKALAPADAAGVAYGGEQLDDAAATLEINGLAMQINEAGRWALTTGGTTFLTNMEAKYLKDGTR